MALGDLLPGEEATEAFPSTTPEWTGMPVYLIQKGYAGHAASFSSREGEAN
jgi:hypothetical protein